MKKIFSFICVFALVITLCMGSVSAYIVPKGMGISYEEGASGESVLSTKVYGLIGDVDLNSKVNIRDATLVQKSLANIQKLDFYGEALADADYSGRINVKDATAIQKWVAGIKGSAPVNHLLYATNDQAQIECLLGNWRGEMNIANELNLGFTAEGMEIQVDDVGVMVNLDFNADNTYKIEADKSSFPDTVNELKAQYKIALTDFLENFIKENKLNATVLDVVKTSGYNSLDDMVEDIVSEDEITEALAEFYREGRYKVINDAIYLSDDITHIPEMGKNTIYYDFSDGNIILTKSDEVISNNLLPIYLTK